MKRKPTIEQLCTACHNEDSHAEHVTRLALTIFDGIRRPFGLPASDRRLLTAVGRLHDIGYRSHPANHANAAAAIILRGGIASFRAVECRDIAAAILLHQKRYERRIQHKLIQDLRHDGRAFRLAAILRVADGLDHGHIQDISISSIRSLRGNIRIALRGEGIQRNVPSAEAKADLWQKVFSSGVVFDVKGTGTRPRKLCASGGRHSILETARRLLCVHCRTLDDSRRAAMASVHPAALHDIRVAIRRLNATLRVFRKPLERIHAARLAVRLSRINSILGPIRDSEVWVATLHNQKLASKLTHFPTWPAYLAFQEAEYKRGMRRLNGLLRSRRFISLMDDMEYFIRIEMQNLMRQQAVKPVVPFAVSHLKRIVKGLGDHIDVSPEMDPEDLHEIRGLCRRGRYCAEFFTPALGVDAADLACRFKGLADPLGRIHDLDVAQDRIRKQRVKPPKRLTNILQRRRTSAWKTFAAAWKAFCRRKHQKRVIRRLQ